MPGLSLMYFSRKRREIASKAKLTLQITLRILMLNLRRLEAL